MTETDRLLAEGGMLDHSGEKVNGVEVPTGSLREEVADDVPTMLSEGEFVMPADVVRFIGLKTLMKLRDEAKRGLARMEEMGQVGNAREVANPDQTFEQEDDQFESDIDSIIGEVETEQAFAAGGVVTRSQAGGRSGTSNRGTGSGSIVRGSDLSKAPKNPVVDVRYYKHPDGRVIFITFFNNRPSVAIPDGFVEASPEEAKKISVDPAKTDQIAKDTASTTGEKVPTSSAPFGYNPDGTKADKPQLTETQNDFFDWLAEDQTRQDAWGASLNKGIAGVIGPVFGALGGPVAGIAVALGQKAAEVKGDIKGAINDQMDLWKQFQKDRDEGNTPGTRLTTDAAARSMRSGFVPESETDRAIREGQATFEDTVGRVLAGRQESEQQPVESVLEGTWGRETRQSSPIVQEQGVLSTTDTTTTGRDESSTGQLSTTDQSIDYDTYDPFDTGVVSPPPPPPPPPEPVAQSFPVTSSNTNYSQNSGLTSYTGSINGQTYTATTSDSSYTPTYVGSSEGEAKGGLISKRKRAEYAERKEAKKKGLASKR